MSHFCTPSRPAAAFANQAGIEWLKVREFQAKIKPWKQYFSSLKLHLQKCFFPEIPSLGYWNDLQMHHIFYCLKVFCFDKYLKFNCSPCFEVFAMLLDFSYWKIQNQMTKFSLLTASQCYWGTSIYIFINPLFLNYLGWVLPKLGFRR